MKKLTLFLLAFLTFQLSQAQSPVNLGLKAGFNSSKISTNLDDFDESSVNNYLAGAFLRVNLGKIYLQPEAYFSSKGGKLSEITGSGATEAVNSFDLKAIDVPVLLGYKLIDKEAFNLRLNAGPVLSFLLEKELNEAAVMDVDQLKDHYFGYQYGAGIDLWVLSLDVRMENSFGDIYSGRGDEKTQTFLVTLGIKLL
ncbi:porin family protein [Gaoshiqia sediminis]|uniref:PorT family protein n=1 Tax=Gaoshiqia sediminis TaxID=2986998 RepID=A0AA41Y6Q1_9BACT|nr:porin family protein [Gaoshiqia sediminis]MCW0482122.1 PorT family protein [Gaoshiqia sediminis]